MDKEIKFIKDKCKNNKQELDDVNFKLKSLEAEQVLLTKTVQVSEDKIYDINTEMRNITDNVRKCSSETRSESHENIRIDTSKIRPNIKCKYCL